MTATFTNTATATFTRTHAIYLASKIAADLRQMQRFYGSPSDDMIDKYVEEVVILLVNEYLDYVEYGFKRDGNRVISLKYVVSTDGIIQTDDDTGRVLPGRDINGATRFSILSKNTKFSNLSYEEQKKIEDSLPIDRSPASSPSNGNGYWTSDKTYSTNGTGVSRSTFRPY